MAAAVFLPSPIARMTVAPPREKLIKIEARIVRQAKVFTSGRLGSPSRVSCLEGSSSASARSAGLHDDRASNDGCDSGKDLAARLGGRLGVR